MKEPTKKWYGGRFEQHRRPKYEKLARAKIKGLGSPLGKSYQKITPADWIKRQRGWDYNRKMLETQFPEIFSTVFFSKLKRLGGRHEGEVRELLIDRAQPFVSTSGIHWYKLAIKKFNKGAKSNPENQARTLHSLHLMVDYLVKTGQLPQSPFEIRIPEVIAYKGPFLVMRHLGEEHNIRADSENLPRALKEQIFQAVIGLGIKITQSQRKLIRQFKDAGLQYPSPDFLPSNVIAAVKNNKITRIWIFDQFSGPSGTTERRRFLDKGTQRMTDRQKWGLE